MRFTLRLIGYLFLFVSMLSGLVFSGQVLDADPPPQTPRNGHVTITLKWYHSFQFAGYYAALLKGYFQDEGLSITILEGSPTNRPIESLRLARAEYAIADGEVIIDALKGEPIVAVMPLFQHSPYILLSRYKSNIQQPEDLRGKRIMASPGSGLRLVKALLRQANVPVEDVRIVPHTQNTDDLVQGRVDVTTAYITDEPYYLLERGITPGIMRAGNFGFDGYGDVLFAARHEAVMHPDRVEAMKRAVTKGWRYALDNPEEIIEYILTLEPVRKRHVTRDRLQYEALNIRSLIAPDIFPIGTMSAERWKQVVGLFATEEDSVDEEAVENYIFNSPVLTTIEWVRLYSVVLIIALLIIGVIILWNYQLRRRVRERTEQLEASEEKYMSLFRDNNSVILVIDPDTGGIHNANEAAVRYYGYSRERLLTMHIDDINTLPFPAIKERIRHVIEGHVRSYEFNHRLANGETRNVETFPSIVRDGDKKYIVSIVHDITEQKRNQTLLQRQASFIEQTSDAFVIESLDGVILFWNRGAERLYGWAASDVVGKRVNDMMSKPWTPSYEEISRLVHQWGEWRGEIRQTDILGKQLIVFSRRLLLKKPDGTPDSILVVNSDLTELREAEIRRYRSQRMESLGTLAGGIAHDLNNVLAPIILSVDLLKSRTTDSKSQEILKRVLISAERGASIVKQVLTYARGVEGKRLPLNPRVLISEIKQLIQETFPKNITLSVSISADCRSVVGDLTQLHQVLLNLCVNSRDAMPDGGTLHIGAENARLSEADIALEAVAPGEYVAITVRDTGHGIPKEYLDKIFEAFFTTKPQGKGTGLGLSTAYGIVRSHSGFIRVASSPDKGATFTIYLPAAADDHTADAELQEEAMSPRGNGELILVVDDETSVREIARNVLESHGYRVLTAENGLDGLNKFNQNLFDIRLVVTDLMMPVLDGAAFIHRIQTIKNNVPVIGMTGHLPSQEEKQSKTLAHIPVVVKPFTTSALLHKVAAALRK